MTIKQIKDNIRIKVVRDELGEHYVGTFKIGYAVDCVQYPRPMEIKEIEECIKHNIICTLYEDRRKDLYQAVLDFCSCEPWNFGQMLEKRDALFRAASVQPPELAPIP